MRASLLVCSPFLACFLFLTAPPAAAQTWTYAKSDHFEVYTTGGDRRAREALTHFERVHAFFVDVLQLSPRTTTPTRLIVFSNDRQFAPYRPSAVAAAYYAAGADRDYIVMKSLDDESLPIVVHEYAHLIFRHSGDRYPLWLNEGLAEFYATMKPDGNRMTVGMASPDRLRYLAADVALMDLDRLFAVRHDSPEYNTTSHVGVFYSQSWALVHMLMTDGRYSADSHRFLALAGSGTATADALQQVYGRTTAEVARDLNLYIRRHDWAYFAATYRSPPAAAVQTRRVEPFEAELVTTNLLANLRNREDEARAAFERLSAQQPDNLELVESRAYFELRRRQTETALPLLLRAASLGSTNPAVYRDLARVEPSRAEEFLPRALTLAPDDLDLRLHYASIVLRAGRAQHALALLGEVRQVNAEHAFQFFQLLANARMRANDVDAGRAAALRAQEYAAPGDEAAYAARLLESIDSFIAARDDAHAAQERRQRALERAAAGGDLSLTADAGDAAGPVPSIEDLSVEPAPFTPGAGARAQPLIVTVTGRIVHMVCGESPVVEVETSSGTLRLHIDNPLAISVRGRAEATVDLHCGAQSGPAIRVGYLPVVDAGRKTSGNLRVLDYDPQ